MMSTINFLQVLEGYVSVNLGGCDIGMAQQSLYRAQVGSVFDHMSGATMAQHMRARMTA